MSDPCKDLADQVNELRANYLALRLELAQAPPDERGPLAREIFQALRLWQSARLALLQCRTPPPNVILDGVEVTQAIQYLHSPLVPCPDFPGPSGDCPDNGVPLVAGKATIVRVYAGTSGKPSVPIDKLTAILETRQAGSSTWNLPLAPYNVESVAAIQASAIDRGDPDQTLNFRLQADQCQGTVEYRLSVFEPLHSGDPDYSAVTTGTMEFTNTRPLRLRVVRIRYQNAARGMNVPAPTTTDFWKTASYVQKTFPVASIEVVADSEELYDGDFTSYFESVPSAQGTTGAVFHILYRLLLAENQPSDVLYFALVPGSPANQTAAGWAIGVAAGRMSIATTLMGSTMAQEVAHNCGFPNHAPCGEPPSPDPSYPVYGSYFSGSIGEYGFDNTDNAVFKPTDYADFMSYCTPAWISPYTHKGLLKNFDASARVQPAAFGDYLQLRLTIQANGACVVEGPAFHLRRSILEPVGRATPYVLELHGKREEILEAIPLLDGDFDERPGESPVTFSIAIPWHEATARLVVMEGDKTLHDISVEPNPPKVRLVTPANGGSLNGKIQITWTGDRHRPMNYLLRYSHDGGNTWRVVATRLASAEQLIDFDSLPGGPQCVLQLLASSGVRTAEATSPPFSVDIKPSQVLIISPEDGAKFGPKDTVKLYGAVMSIQNDASAQDLKWTSSIDGLLGFGPQLCADRISAGVHRITLSLRTQSGVSKTVAIQVAR